MPRNLDELHAEVDALYAERKLGMPRARVAPTARPRVRSDQVLALMEALYCELDELREEVRLLEMRLGEEIPF